MGSIFAIIACFIQTLKDSASKKVSSNVEGSVSSFASFLYALPFYFITLLILYFLGYENFQYTQNFLLLVSLRALTDAFAETCKMYAFQYGNLSTVTALLTLHPIITILLSPIITNDQLNIKILIGVCLAVAGSIIIVFQKHEKLNLKCVLFGLSASIFFSLNVCLDRLSVQSASATFSAFIMTLISCALILPWILFKKQKMQQLAVNNKIFLTRGFFETLFMIFKFISLQYITAPHWAAISRLAILFSVFSGSFYFKEKYFIRKLLGSIIIILGIAIALVF